MATVVVVGASVAGMAAAARLAKAGHRVELYEATDRLGGRWAAEELASGVRVDRAPAVLGFPAPWRDLFRKSGRALEAELARFGVELAPAPPARYVFPDGTDLWWPTDRGEQFATLHQRFGPGVAHRWRELVDGLAEVWQVIRWLGLEAELRDRDQLTRSVRRRLQHRRSLAQIAEQAGNPQLSAIVRSWAYRQGSEPERAPAWCAVGLWVEATFGRWTVRGSGDATGRSSVLAEVLVERLQLRKVGLHLSSPVTAVRVEGGRVSGVVLPDPDSSPVPATAVISTVDPWQTLEHLLPAGVGRPLRRNLSRLRPAAAPTISHRLLPTTVPDVTETVALSADGRPVISYVRPIPDGAVETLHDFRRTHPDPGAGVAWDGFASWLRRPPVTTGVPGLFLAGPSSPGGNGPSQVLLSGALASYGVDHRLTPS